MLISGMQKCKCGLDKVAVNEAQKCLKCDAEPGNSTLLVTCEDPGEDKMRQVLAASGVAIPKVKADVQMDRGIGIPKNEPNKPAQSAQIVSAAPKAPQFVAQVQQALSIMRNLTMPKDIRQFKTISKIITQMESLVGEGK